MTVQYRLFADMVLVGVYETYEEAEEELKKREANNPEFVYEIHSNE